MRKVCLKALVLALAFVGLQGLTTRAQAQLVTNLIQYTNTWRYDSTGRNLGTNWRTSTYTEDAPWLGPIPGLIGYETDNKAAYVTLAGNFTDIPAINTTTTFYFRTTFNFPGSPNGAVLIATNLVDDGCVIYINGSRVGGVRMGDGVNSATLTTAGAPEPPQLSIVTLTNLGGVLRNGPNLIAVEVHQSAVPSSDMVFGMRLTGFIPQALTITNQPQSQTAVVGDALALTVGVSGGPVSYQWQRNGVNINNATNATYNSPVVLNSAGDYRVIVSNPVSTNISSVATITVVEDLEGPKLLQAIINNNTFPAQPFPTVNVIFDERVNAVQTGDPLFPSSARNTNNYRLVSVANPAQSYFITNVLHQISAVGSIAVSSALLIVPDPNFDTNGSYYVIVNNISDIRGYNINPNSVIGVSRQVITNLTQMSDAWDYHGLAFFDPDYSSLFTTNLWYRTNFVQVAPYWSPGFGIFYFDNGGGNVLCSGDDLGSQISDQDGPPHLFRRTFRLPANFDRSAQFRIRYFVDDGLVLYLNGRQIFTNNAPAGPYNENSRAVSVVADGSCQTNILNSITNLLSGPTPTTNWLAAHVLQASPSGNDVYFGFEMDAQTLVTSSIPTNPPAPYRITKVRQGNTHTLSWPSNYYGFVLQYTTNLNSTTNWIQVKDQSNPYTIIANPPPSTGPRRFYRLSNR